MSWLVLDTATPVAVVAIVDGGRVLASVELTETRRHAENLIGAIDRALDQAGLPLDRIAGVGVGRGPGSFIGVRTGIATAKGIALGREIPLVGVSTLLAVAASADQPEGTGLVTLDAKRGEVYAVAVEHRAGRIMLLEQAAPQPPDQAAQRAAALNFCVGSGLENQVRQIGPNAEGLARVLAWRIENGVADELDSLVPDYAREPDARLPAQMTSR